MTEPFYLFNREAVIASLLFAGTIASLALFERFFSPSKSVVVVLEGLIGAGKTTAVESLISLAKESGQFDEVIKIPEPIKKKVLDDYIKDMKTGNKKLRAWSFQMNTAVKRLHDYERAKSLALEKPRRLVIIDRGLYGNEAFARMQCKRGAFDGQDLLLYNEEIGVSDGSLATLQNDPIYKVLYLRCTPETAWRRTLARGDKEEVGGYDLQYMRDLYNAHEEVLANRKVTIIDWENDQVVNDGKINAKLLLDKIKEMN
jgi:deoxyadenosine/deoxycytidine kinase